MLSTWLEPAKVTMNYTCDVVSIPWILRGGTLKLRDSIIVDIDKDCSNKVSLVLEQFTFVDHKNGDNKVTYKFFERPA